MASHAKRMNRRQFRKSGWLKEFSGPKSQHPEFREVLLETIKVRGELERKLRRVNMEREFVYSETLNCQEPPNKIVLREGMPVKVAYVIHIDFGDGI